MPNHRRCRAHSGAPPDPAADHAADHAAKAVRMTLVRLLLAAAQEDSECPLNTSLLPALAADSPAGPQQGRAPFAA